MKKSKYLIIYEFGQMFKKNELTPSLINDLEIGILEIIDIEKMIRLGVGENTEEILDFPEEEA